MKIASVVCTYPPYAGGIGNSAYRINRLLEDRNEIRVFTPATVKPWLRKGHGAFMPSLLWKLRGADIIYLHYPFFGTAEIVWLYKRWHPRTKLIIQYHMDVEGLGFFGTILSWPSRLLQASLFDRADKIVVSSLDYVKNGQLKKYYSGHQEKFVEIPFGLDLERFQPSLAHRHLENKVFARAQEIVNFVDEKIIKRNRADLLFVGGLDRAHYFKGVDVLLDALLLCQNRRFRLKVVGDGDLRPEYEAKAERLGLKNQVEFAGHLDDDALVRAFQAADVFILPSINGNEAFGLVLIEAMACGVPVIASDLPGVRSVFQEGQEGLLAEPGNAADLAAKLDSLISDPEQRRRMAEAARKLAVAKYDENKIKDRLSQLFR